MAWWLQYAAMLPCRVLLGWLQCCLGVLLCSRRAVQVLLGYTNSVILVEALFASELDSCFGEPMLDIEVLRLTDDIEVWRRCMHGAGGWKLLES